MKIAVMSDLHTDFGIGGLKRWTPPECDVVVLAGDVSTGVAGVLWAIRKFSVPTIYVPGNHEYYGKRVMAEHLARMKEKAAGTHVMVLDREAVVLAGARFVCATLWTDYALHGNPYVDLLAARDLMNDHAQIMKAPRTPFLPEDALAEHKLARRFIEDTLAEPFEGPSVVVTHHLPSERCVGPKHRHSRANPMYASNLDALIGGLAPELWIHGHSHESTDLALGATRIVANPRGYLDRGKPENPRFDPDFRVELPVPSPASGAEP